MTDKLVSQEQQEEMAKAKIVGEIETVPERKKRQYRNGHRGHAKFREAVKLAQETYRQVKASMSLEEWSVDENGNHISLSESGITWREVWRHIMSLSLKGLIEIALEKIKKG